MSILMWQNLTYFENQTLLYKAASTVEGRRWIYWRQLVLFYASLYLFYLQWASPLQLIGYFDWITLGGLPSELHAYLALFFLTTALLYKLAYVNKEHAMIIELMHDTLLVKQSPVFRHLGPVNHLLQKQIIRTSLLLLNAYQIIYLFTDSYILWIWFTSYRQYYQNQDWFSSLVIGFAHHVNVLINLVALYYMIYICLFVGLLYNVVTLSLFARLNQLKCFIKTRLKLNQFKVNRFYRVFRVHRECLRFIFSSNRLFGVVMSGFVLMNSPTNAYFLMVLCLRPMTLQNQLFLLLIVSNLLLINFIFHLIAAQYSRRLHQPARIMISPYVSWQDSFAHRLQLQIKYANYLNALHCCNRYGLTYLKSTLISMASFCKYLLFFFKFVMISYKILIKAQQ